MKKESLYVSPGIGEYSAVAESNFAQSGTEWYRKSGTGNFNYEVEDDETWI